MSAHFRNVVVATLVGPWHRNSRPGEGGQVHLEPNVHVDLNGKARYNHLQAGAHHFTAPPRSGFHSYGSCSHCATPLDIQIEQGQTGQTSHSTCAVRSSHRNSPELIRSSLDRVPEDGAMNFNQDDDEGPRYLEGVPLNDDASEIERELEEELEEHGLYRGSYKRLILLYGFVPLTFTIAFTTFAALPYVVYPSQDTKRPYPSMPYFPSPIPELLVSIALWSLSYVLQDPLYASVAYVTGPSRSTSMLVPTTASTLLQTVVSVFLRISALNLLDIPRFAISTRPTTHDPTFRRVWWVALGWTFAEAIVAIKQGYEAIALYRDVLVSVHPHEDNPETRDTPSEGDRTQRKNETTPLETIRPNSSPSPRESYRDRSLSNSPDPSAAHGSSEPADGRRQTTIELFNQQVEDDVYGQSRELDEDGERQPLLRHPRSDRRRELEEALRLQVDQDIDQLIAMRARDELEEIYGMPIIHIPVFLACLHRVNALLESLGSLLLISHAYIQSTLAVTPPVSFLHLIHPHPQETPRTNTPLLITLPVVALVHYFLSILHTSLVLPKFGVPAVVYTGSLVSLMMFFSGLGVWNGLT